MLNAVIIGLLAFVCLTYGQQVEIISPSNCTGYTFYPGIGHYKYHTSLKSWRDAWLACYNENAKLVIMNSKAERDVIIHLVAENESPRWVHIGYNRLFNPASHVFIAVDGQRLDQLPFMEWGAGEPNNDKGDEECGAIGPNGLLNDYACYWLRPFICELN